MRWLARSHPGQVKLAWERRWGQPADGNRLWESVPFAAHLAGLLAHRMLDQDEGPPDQRSVEALIRRVHDEGDGAGYDEIAAELDAIAEAGGDPFADVNEGK